jgi:hypothetical protein
LLYLCKDPREPNCYWFHGITFREFHAALRLSSPLLLLAPELLQGVDLTEDPHTRFSIITRADLPQVASLDLYHECGDFAWVDYSPRFPLAKLPPIDFASLLYLARTYRVLHSSFFHSLKNRFVYLSHDDGYVLKLYARRPQDVRKLLARTATAKARHFLGRSLSPKIGAHLLQQASRGILLDFRSDKNHPSATPRYTYPGRFQCMDHLLKVVHGGAQAQAHAAMLQL